MMNETKEIKTMENKMKEVASLLGVELGERFNVKYFKAYNPFCLTEDGLIDRDKCFRSDILKCLLTGELEIERPILTDKEKRYLENVLRPFKDRIVYIQKVYLWSKEHIKVQLNHDEAISFPYFETGSMYKDMESDKGYIVGELGLFDETE